VHAISADRLCPRIDEAAARWASRFVMHHTRRMLFMARGHVADNPFHAECLKLMEKLRAAPAAQLPHSVLLKRMKTNAKGFRDLIETLLQRGDVVIREVTTSGRTGFVYRLAEGERRVKEVKEAPSRR
jgi:hypothetical protein